MKAEGSAQNPDAQHVRGNCIQSRDVDLVELITPKVCCVGVGVGVGVGVVYTTYDQQAAVFHSGTLS